MANALGVTGASIDLPASIPAPVAAAINEFAWGLAAHTEDVRSVLLFGGVARGEFLTGTSDVNVLVVLAKIGLDPLRRLAPLFRETRKKIPLAPLFLVAGELERAADVFPTRLLDVRDHHIVLFGDDPVKDVMPPSEALRLRVETELRNQSMRLRRRYVLAGDRVDVLTDLVDESFPPACAALAALLVLDGQPRPAQRKELLEMVAERFALNRETLLSVLAWRSGSAPVADHREAALAAWMDVLDAAVAVADRYKVRAA